MLSSTYGRQIAYITKRQQLRAHEEEMRQKLWDMEANYGRGGGGKREADHSDNDEEEEPNDGGEGEGLVEEKQTGLS